MSVRAVAWLAIELGPQGCGSGAWLPRTRCRAWSARWCSVAACAGCRPGGCLSSTTWCAACSSAPLRPRARPGRASYVLLAVLVMRTRLRESGHVYAVDQAATRGGLAVGALRAMLAARSAVLLTASPFGTALGGSGLATRGARRRRVRPAARPAQEPVGAWVGASPVRVHHVNWTPPGWCAQHLRDLARGCARQSCSRQSRPASRTFMATVTRLSVPSLAKMRVTFAFTVATLM